MSSPETAVTNAIATADFRSLFPTAAHDAPLVTSGDAIAHYPAIELPMLYAYEQLILAAIVRAIAPRTIIEFGTGRGSGTFVLAANSPANARVFTLDLVSAARGEYTQKILRDNNDVGLAYRTTPEASKITQLLVPPGAPMHETLTGLHRTADFIYVDGDHGYAGVRDDTIAALDLAGPNAVLLWHDFYDFPTYIHEGAAKRGVFPWLNEFAAKNEMLLYHIDGTYFVAGSKIWKDTPPEKTRVRQPGDRPHPFGARIVRQGEA
jgi:predicted O-methyltransferase YrrM